MQQEANCTVVAIVQRDMKLLLDNNPHTVFLDLENTKSVIGLARERFPAHSHSMLVRHFLCCKGTIASHFYVRGHHFRFGGKIASNGNWNVRRPTYFKHPLPESVNQRIFSPTGKSDAQVTRAPNT